ncbi:MAG: carbonic anhydrase family protein [Candidatus Dadabacteria bacterium]|nr:carbonic anhydrase family protein [Candidatus Dadabacteria bacterium]
MTCWGYKGDEGPDNWGSLSPEYAACALGRMQSPIDITDAFPVKGPALKFDYKPCSLKILNTGHALQVNYAPGSTLTAAGEVYELLQFHFHIPSEHAFDGSHAAMEAHFVHKNPEGTLAVVGIMMEVGAKNHALAAVFNNVPNKAGMEVDVVGTTVDASTILPTATTEYFHYKGSLTTPPCSEGVHWFIFPDAIEVSAEQVGNFKQMFGYNARPLQKRNNRLLIVSS